MIYIIKEEKEIKKHDIKQIIDCNNKSLEEFYSELKELKLNDKNNIGLLNGTKEQKSLLDFYLYYQNSKKNIDKAIKEYNKNLNEKDNFIIKNAIKKLAIANKGGKNLRGMLINLAYDITGEEDTNPMPLIIAYELFQTSILIHDDIIDKATLRRGEKTIPENYIEEFKKNDEKSKHIANSLALCLGDYGFFKTNEILLKNYGKNENFAELFSYYNKIVINTIKGEILDVYLPYKEEYKLGNPTKEKEVLDIYKLKTSYYTIIGPFTLGLILGNTKQSVYEKYEEFLLNIGISFQIKDDILGIYSKESTLGKSTISDIKEYKQTILYTTVEGKYKKELLKYYGKEKLNQKEIAKVKDIFTKSGALNYATNKMNEHFNKSKEILKNLKIKNEYKSILLGLIIYLQLRNK